MTRRFRLVAWLVVILFLSGCGASRHTLKSGTHTEVETEQAVQTGTEEKNAEAVTVKTAVTRDKEVVTEVTEFDTALPVDPTTGTPPVKRKTIQTQRTAAQAQQFVTADRSTTAGTFENRESVEKSDTSTTVEDASGRGLNWIQSALCLVGIFAVLSLITGLIIKRLKG